MKLRYINFSFLALVFLMFMVSCKKKDYLIDEGIHNAKTSLSTYDYLKNHSWHSFDTFILIIDHYKMQDELNKSATVFATTDYSVKRFMDLKQSALRQINEKLTYTLDSLYKDVPADSVRQYLFEPRITLASAKVDPEIDLVKSKANTQCGFSKVLLQTSPENYLQFTTTPSYSLYYTLVRGALDVPGVISPANEIDIRVQCQTTGIETASGTTLHVLSNQHTFVRF